jgi:hypothetical protein
MSFLFKRTVGVIRKWRKNRYSPIDDRVRGFIEIKKGTYLLFRAARKESGTTKLVTRVVNVPLWELAHLSRCRGMRPTYGKTKLQYLKLPYPNLVSDLEKKISWELLRA